MQARRTVIAAAFIVLMVAAAGAQSGYDLFQLALMKERAEQNLPEAIRLYERIVKDFKSNRPLVAKTLVQLGSVFEREKDTQRAKTAYVRVTQEFATETEALAEAQGRLAALGGAPVQNGPTLRVAATGDEADSGAWITNDGRFMARPHWETGDLAVRDMVLGTTTRMKAKAGTWDAGDDRDAEVDEAMLSPDLRWIVYTWLNGGPDSDYQLRMMPNQVGGKPRVLVKSSEYGEFRFAGWLDGKSILAALRKPDRTWLLARISNLDSGSPTVQPLKSLGWRLGRSRFRVSPDGRYVAYSAMPADPGKAPDYPFEEPAQLHIYVLATDGTGAETAVVRGSSINESPVWTPDGRRVVFVSNRSGSSFGLWSVGVQNGKVTDGPLLVNTSVAGRIRPVALTASGAFFYTPATSDTPGKDIFVARIDGSTGKVTGSSVHLVDNLPDRNLAAAWSPDGKKVAFVRQRPGFANAAIDRDAFALVIYDREKDSENEFPIPYLASAPPQWFRDGTSVLIYQRYDGGRVYKVDIENGNRRSIEAIVHASLPQGVVSALLSPDEKTLYVGAQGPGNPVKWEIVAFDLATGEQRPVWTPEGAANNIQDFALSPDGRSLGFTLRRAEWTSTHLLTVNVDGGKAAELAQSVKRGTVAWTSRGIYFSTDEDRPRLMRIAQDGGRPEPAGVAGGIAPVSLSPDGATILLNESTRTNADAQLYVIENLTSLWKATAGN